MNSSSPDDVTFNPLSNSSSPVMSRLNGPLKKVADFLVSDKLLGKGTFGKVFEAIHGQKRIAVKVIARKPIDGCSVLYQCLNQEVSVLQALNNESEHAIKFFGYEKSTNSYYLAFEKCSSQSLGNLLQKAQSAQIPLPISKVALYAQQLIKGVQFLRSKDVVHRDLKPENLLLSTSGKFLKICDFGFSIIQKKGQMINQYAGTADYMAPEILKEQDYDSSVDKWSLGVILFQLLFAGINPYVSSNNDSKTVKELEDIEEMLPSLMQDLCEQFNYEEELSNQELEVVQQLIDLIDGLLKIDPEERLSWEEIFDSYLVKKVKFEYED